MSKPLFISKRLAARLKTVESRNRARAHAINRRLPKRDHVEIEIVDFVQIVLDWNGCCCICQQEIDLALPGTDMDGLTLEHMVSLAQKGGHIARNIGPAHRRCNQKKADEKDGPAAAKIKRRLGLTGPKARKRRREAKGLVKKKPPGWVSPLSKSHKSYRKPVWSRK